MESVLRLRTVEEEKKKREHGVALHSLKGAKDRFDRVVEDIGEHDRRREEEGEGKVTVQELRADYFYARLLERRKDTQRKSVERAEGIAAARRAELIAAAQRKKTVERLKERAQQNYEKEAAKEEQRIVDELTALKYKSPVTK
jgi:flagellar export protein FliJ